MLSDRIESFLIVEKTATPAPLGAGVCYTGSGGGIRTPDLWVMSPTSCRCSTPRRAGAPRPPGGPGVGGVRGGLASQGVTPPVLSGAALGHDRVRDGTGWGQHALGHGRPPPPDPGVGTNLHCAMTATDRGLPPPLPGRPRALHVLTHSASPTPHDGAVHPAAPGRDRRREILRPCGRATSLWRGPPRHVRCGAAAS